MTLADLLTFMLATTLLVTSPGPNGVLIARTVPTSGRSAGFANIAGFFTAFFVHGTLSILGFSVIVMHSATAFAVVKYLGAAYLVWIGLRSLVAAVRGIARLDRVDPARRKRTLVRAYAEGFLTNALNPKVSMFYLAVFPHFIEPGGHAVATAYLLVFLHATINVVWFGSIVMLFSRLSAATRNPVFQRWLKGATGVVFIGFGVKLASVRAPV